MTTLLLVALGMAGAVLVVTALTAIARTTPRNDESRGPWGILEVHIDREADLDAQQRRWQTSLVAALRQPGRWSDLVADIRRLEASLEVGRDPEPPKRFDASWLDDRLRSLEAALPDRGDAQ